MSHVKSNHRGAKISRKKLTINDAMVASTRKNKIFYQGIAVGM